MSYVPIEGFYHETEPQQRRSALEIMRGWVSSFIMPSEAPLCMSEHSRPGAQPPQVVQPEQVQA